MDASATNCKVRSPKTSAGRRTANQETANGLRGAASASIHSFITRIYPEDCSSTSQQRSTLRVTTSTSDPRRIAEARLQRQFLVGESPHRNAAAVVRALCAVQSQDFAGAKWALAMRSDGLDEAAIDAAVDRGDVVRTHVMRPTWHFVAPEDLRWMQALTGHRVARIMASYNVKLGLTPAVLRKSLDVIGKSLAEQGPLTRTQLKAELERARINTEGTQRLAHLVMQAEIEALVCNGPQRGKQSTYALVGERVTKSRLLEGDEALHELTVRYFASRAPATAHDFSWWSGLTLAECTRGIVMTGKQLQHITLNEKGYFVPPDFELPSKVSAAAHLLPNYDEYFIGFKDRSAIGQRLGHSALVTGGNALIGHVVAIDGQLVGGWRRGFEEGKTVLRFELMVKLKRKEHSSLKRAVERFSDYTGSAILVSGL